MIALLILLVFNFYALVDSKSGVSCIYFWKDDVRRKKIFFMSSSAVEEYISTEWNTSVKIFANTATNLYPNFGSNF